MQCAVLLRPQEQKMKKKEIYNSMKPKEKKYFFNFFKKNKSCDVRNSKNIKKKFNKNERKEI